MEKRNTMKIIFLDTETTGLPRNKLKDALEEKGNWPDIVSFCWMVYDGRERVKKEVHLIRPDGYRIPPESTRIHGISQERAEQEGKPLMDVMRVFLQDVTGAHLIIAHNLEFDRNVIFNACRWRLGIHPLDSWKREAEFCSMKMATHELCLPSKWGHRAGYKFPSLAELYVSQFGHRFDGAHTADGDVEALTEIVWARWDIVTSGDIVT